MRYYCVYDRKSSASIKKFEAPSDGVATREISDALRSSEPLRHNALDFVLRFIGDYDEMTCKWDLDNAPADVVELAELVNYDA